MKPIRFKDRRDAALFKVGETLYSPDGGKTWIRGNPPPPGARRGPVATVTKVDRQRGSITVK